MLNGLLGGAVAGAVEVAAATCIQAAVRRRLVRGSLDRLRVLYPNLAALGLTARRVCNDSRESLAGGTRSACGEYLCSCALVLCCRSSLCS